MNVHEYNPGDSIECLPSELSFTSERIRRECKTCGGKGTWSVGYFYGDRVRKCECCGSVILMRPHLTKRQKLIKETLRSLRCV